MASKIQIVLAAQADDIICAAEARGGKFMGLVNVDKGNGMTETLLHIVGGYRFETKKEAIEAAEATVEQAKEAVAETTPQDSEPEPPEGPPDELKIGDELEFEGEDEEGNPIALKGVVEKIGRKYATVKDENDRKHKLLLSDIQ